MIYSLNPKVAYRFHWNWLVAWEEVIIYIQRNHWHCCRVVIVVIAARRLVFCLIQNKRKKKLGKTHRNRSKVTWWENQSNRVVCTHIQLHSYTTMNRIKEKGKKTKITFMNDAQCVTAATLKLTTFLLSSVFHFFFSLFFIYISFLFFTLPLNARPYP